MAQKFYGSLNLTAILAAAQQKHSAFVKHENGNIYFNCNVWLNDEPDKYDNVMSIKLSCTKDKVETEGKVYIGNFKESEDATDPINKKDIANISSIADDLPF